MARRLVVLAVFAAVLLYTFHLYSFRYFLLDDFNNLGIVQSETTGHIFRYLLDPTSDFFRPGAMILYRLLWIAAGLHYAPYAWFAFALHVLNTWLLYRVLLRVTRAPLATACGTLLFALQPTFAGVYFTFGTVFDLSCATVMLLALLAHMHLERPWQGGLALAALLFWAMKCKEMAISLPAICLSYDLLIAQRRGVRAYLVRFGPSAIVAGWFLYVRLKQMLEPRPDDAYHMEISARAFLRGLGWYCNVLVDPIAVTARNWGRWGVGWALGLAWLAFRRDRQALFFAACILFGLLPVLFLPNHRSTFYWYLPFLGVAGLASLLVHRAARFATPSPGTALVGFCLLAAVHVPLSTVRGRPERAFFAALCVEYRAFVEGAQRLPPPPRGATVHVDSRPRLFSDVVLTSALQVIFRDPTLSATSAGAADYHIDFQHGEVVRR